MIAFTGSMKIAQDDSNILKMRSGANKWVSERTRAQRSALAKRAVWSKRVIGASEWVSERASGPILTSVLHFIANRRRFLKDWVKCLRKNVSHSISPRSLWCCDFCFIFDAYSHAAWRKTQKNRIGTKFVRNTVRIFLPWMLLYFGLRFWDRKKQRIKRDGEWSDLLLLKLNVFSHKWSLNLFLVSLILLCLE